MISDNAKVGRANSAFVLSAAITVLFNTALAWAKDACPPVNKFLISLTGHHWTTHGLADVFLFAVLGLIFWSANLGEKIEPKRLAPVLIASVVAAALGLGLWFALF